MPRREALVLLDYKRLATLDPGTDESALMVYDTSRLNPVEWFAKEPNAVILARLPFLKCDQFIIEEVGSFGMPAGKDLFRTAQWSGRFIQAAAMPYRQVLRKTVVAHHNRVAHGRDCTIRQALIDRFGGKEIAIGNKKRPGPLYYVKADAWSALAIAVWAADNPANGTAPCEFSGEQLDAYLRSAPGPGSPL
jgi:hypothetical protein